MQTHARLGRDAIEAAERDAEETVEFLAIKPGERPLPSREVGWRGYPERLAGDGILISARLMALADVFDALICKRVYKPAMPLEQATASFLTGAAPISTRTWSTPFPNGHHWPRSPPPSDDADDVLIPPTTDPDPPRSDGLRRPVPPAFGRHSPSGRFPHGLAYGRSDDLLARLTSDHELHFACRP